MADMISAETASDIDHTPLKRAKKMLIALTLMQGSTN